ncbi:hypothetical protein DXG01_009201 [Tephrocybe rancida]|nr:hypothetical protein DXG01_009201 [Tephrocybe rancida]
MRFSTVAVLSSIALAGFASADCKSNKDCPAGKICVLRGNTGEGACVKPFGSATYRARARHNEALELAARDVVDAVEAIVARSLEDFEDLD